MKLCIDTETYNDVPISHGTYKYASTCEVMLITWAADDGPIFCDDLTAGDGVADLAIMMEAVDEIHAHFAMFDRNVLKRVPALPVPPIEKWRCTMTRALAHGLPGSLDTLGDILQLPLELRKHEDGRPLIHLFCKPQPKNAKLRRATRLTHPEQWAKFKAYAINDIAAMRELDRRLPTWNYSGAELALYHRDQHINDRGFQLDMELVDASASMVEAELSRLGDKALELTNGAARTTQRDALLTHLAEEHGVLLPDMKASTIERRLADPDLPDALKEILNVRLQATTTSTSKFKAMQRGASLDGRVRGTIQFDGAGRTGRDAGRLVQPQNFTRPTMKQAAIEAAITAIKAGCASYVY